MKRWASLLFAGLMLLAPLSGCGSRSEGSEGTTDDTPVTLRIANWSSAGEALERAGTECFTDAFTNKYPNVSFKIDILPDYQNQFQNNMAIGSTNYDVFLVPDCNFGAWASTGVMLDLTDRVQSSDVINIEDMYENVAERYMLNEENLTIGSGKIYALPKDVGPYVMAYNKDLLMDLDSDTLKSGSTSEYMSIYEKYEEHLTATDVFDMDVAIEMFREIKKADPTMYSVGNMQIEGMVWSNGGDFVDDSQTPAVSTVNTPEVIEAYKTYVQMDDEGLMPDGATLTTVDANTLFRQGTLACIVMHRVMVTPFRQIEDFEWDVCPVPGFSAAPTLNSSSGSAGWAVHVNSQNRYWAYKFVEFCASLEGQIAGTEIGFCVPMYDTKDATDALYELDGGKMPSNTECFINAAKNQRKNRLSTLAYSTRWVTTMDTLSGYIFLNPTDKDHMTVEEFLQESDRQINSILQIDYNEATY